MTKVLKRKNASFSPASVLYDYVKSKRFEADTDDWIDIVIEQMDTKKIIPDEMIVDMARKLDKIKEHTYD